MTTNITNHFNGAIDSLTQFAGNTPELIRTITKTSLEGLALVSTGVAAISLYAGLGSGMLTGVTWMIEGLAGGGILTGLIGQFSLQALSIGGISGGVAIIAASGYSLLSQAQN